MDQSQIAELYDRHAKPGYGAVKPDELAFIQSLIAEHKPKSFIEVGMASGLSTGFIALFMEQHGGERLVSIDHDDTFFGDASKPNGFLVPQLYNGQDLNLELIKHKVAPDLQKNDGDFDMAFIDANHHHPWPAIDMMCLYPRMTGPKIMLHHDLKLFANRSGGRGIGPKYLFDQFPESHRLLSDANNGNIFAVDLNIDRDQFESLLTGLFSLPWSAFPPLSPEQIKKVRGVLKKHYSDALQDHFQACAKTHNKRPQSGGDLDRMARDMQVLKQKMERVQIHLGQVVKETRKLDERTAAVHEMVRKGMLRRILSRISRGTRARTAPKGQTNDP
ncbi:MAG: class I SAM-dependent methyltransferase [Pseudomonadota bacterium]